MKMVQMLSVCDCLVTQCIAVPPGLSLILLYSNSTLLHCVVRCSIPANHLYFPPTQTLLILHEEGLEDCIGKFGTGHSTPFPAPSLPPGMPSISHFPPLSTVFFGSHPIRNIRPQYADKSISSGDSESRFIKLELEDATSV